MRRFTNREKRLLVLAVIVAVIAAWRLSPRPSPHFITETQHYVIQSSATEAQTREIGQVAEMVYSGYLQMMSDLRRTIEPHPKLGIKLFKDREEFRRCNRVFNWVEGFYRPPFCYQYYSAGEAQPYHWLMHEATHQLNGEVAHLWPQQWLNEGLACYIGTSRIVDGCLHLGEIDTNTYPVWWLGSMRLSGDLAADKQRGAVIPLRVILVGQGGPNMDGHFNLYYLHWWSLVHFLMHCEGGKYREAVGRLIADGGGLDAFEKHVGPVETIEKEWYGYLPELRRQTEQATPPVRLKPL